MDARLVLETGSQPQGATLQLACQHVCHQSDFFLGGDPLEVLAKHLGSKRIVSDI